MSAPQEVAIETFTSHYEACHECARRLGGFCPIGTRLLDEHSAALAAQMAPMPTKPGDA